MILLVIWPKRLPSSGPRAADPTRHKSGVAMRFPRINCIRDDKPVAEADHLSALPAVLDPG
jgi:ATP-dependent DNA ligase